MTGPIAPTRVLGLISGTSHDGIDAAIVEFTSDDGALTGRVLHHSCTSYAPELRARLAASFPPAPTTLAEMCELDTLIGQSFAAVAEAAIADIDGGVDLVVSHGQTVFHWVEADHALGTLQLGQPAWIAERTGSTVLSDVRIRDITAGGHGAPLVSLLDVLLLGAESGPSAALNLGGISNMTVVEGGIARVAFDIGPANALIDAMIAESGVNDLGYDDGGRITAQGTVDEELLKVLLDEPYYALSAPKTTGKELFHGPYVHEMLERSGLRPELPDLLATLAELTARTVAAAIIDADVKSVVVSGGGCSNPALMGRIAAQLDGVRLLRSDDFGAPVDAKEAIAMALIGWCSWHGLPGNETTATGAAERRILGTFTPGRGPLVLPTAVDVPVRSLRLSTV